MTIVMARLVPVSSSGVELCRHWRQAGIQDVRPLPLISVLGYEDLKRKGKKRKGGEGEEEEISR